MRKRPTPSPTELPLPFAYDEQAEEENITALGGMPLLVQAFRSLGAGQSVAKHVHIKQRQRGLDEATYVESFVVLNAAGGDCLDDFEHLRVDTGLTKLIGHEVPSPEAARKFLYQFHDESKVVAAQQQQLALGRASYIPEENAALAGLGMVNREVVQEFGEAHARQDRHHRHGRNDHRELEAGGTAHLSRRHWLPAHVGVVGRTERDRGG